jgi:copper(I)-binding protein
MAEAGDDMAEMQGGEATVGDITVTGVWMREPAEGQTRTAAYGTITNDGDADVTLVSAAVPFDATVEIHETITGDDGAMQMQEVPEGFVVPAGGSFTLEPGGPHIMLIDIDPADIVGVIDLTMVFDDGTEVVVGAPVKVLDMADMGDDMTGTTMAG